MTRHPFGAYIVSYLPPGLGVRMRRRDNLFAQIDWWKSRTSIPVTLIASGWLASDFKLMEIASNLSKITVIEQPAQPLIHNRIACLQAFYASEYAWGIMMDDDAVLYDGPQHNRGPRLFAEMAANGLAAYNGVDVFFPINPQKRPGQNIIWEKNPALYTDNHVFERSMDLKGSMFVVRNFRKEGKPVVLPDPTFTLHGEDRLFALEAVSMGYSVMRCNNIVLKEFNGTSHFEENRKAQMKIGYTALAEKYAVQGLAMKSNSHLHDLKQFWANCWKDKPSKIIV